MGTIIAAWRILILNEEDSANTVPSIRNYVPKLPTFGVIAGVSPTEVQWKGLTLGEPHSGSRCPLYQVSMPSLPFAHTYYFHSFNSMVY